MYTSCFEIITGPKFCPFPSQHAGIPPCVLVELGPFGPRRVMHGIRICVVLCPDLRRLGKSGVPTQSRNPMPPPRHIVGLRDARHAVGALVLFLVGAERGDPKFAAACRYEGVRQFFCFMLRETGACFPPCVKRPFSSPLLTQFSHLLLIPSSPLHH